MTQHVEPRDIIRIFKRVVERLEAQDSRDGEGQSVRNETQSSDLLTTSDSEAEAERDVLRSVASLHISSTSTSPDEAGPEISEPSPFLQVIDTM